jgi:hypothetical protein
MEEFYDQSEVVERSVSSLLPPRRKAEQSEGKLYSTADRPTLEAIYTVNQYVSQKRISSTSSSDPIEQA